MVVKPNFSVCGKKNIFFVDKNDKDILKFITLAKRQSLDNLAILQERIPGRDIGLSTLSSGGVKIWSALYEEKNIIEAKKIKSSTVTLFTTQVTDITELKMNQIAKKIIHLAKSSGWIHFSFRLSIQGDLYLYEINPGLAGDSLATEILPKTNLDTDPFLLDIRAMTNQLKK